MALVKCAECGREISTEAKACPGCGTRAARKSGAGFGKILLIGGGVVVGGWLLFDLVSSAPGIMQCKAAMQMARSSGAMPAGDDVPRVEPVHRFGPANRMTCIAAADGDLYQLTYDTLDAGGVQLMAVVRASDGAVRYSGIGH